MRCRATFCAALVAALAATGCNSLIGAGAPETIGDDAPTDVDPNDPGPPGAVCGDGKREGAEECDDGNAESHDGCVQCMTCGPIPTSLDEPFEHFDDRTGSCYLVEGQNPTGFMQVTSWDGANAHCVTWGGTLVVVSSSDEHNVLQELAMHFGDFMMTMPDAPMEDFLLKADFWVGAKKSGGAVEWVPGEGSDFELPWASDVDAAAEQGHVALDGASLGFVVYPGQGDDPLSYICERAPAAPPPAD
jgi:cysteine-rich repeat protein